MRNEMATEDLAIDPGKEWAHTERIQRRTAIVIGAFLALSVGLLALSGGFVQGPDSRIATGAPRGSRGPHLWGIDNWPILFEVGSVVVGILVIGYFWYRTRKAGSRHPAMVLVGALILLVVMDPWANYVDYATYNPQLLHPPVDWPLVSLAPTVEPYVVLVGYPYFFLLPALFAAFIVRRVGASDSSAATFVNRHPLLSMFGVGLIIGIVWDIPLELFFTRSEIYLYSQVLDSVSVRAGATWQFPLVYETGAMAVTIALVTMLLHQDDRGRTLSDRIGARIPLIKARPALAAVVSSLAILAVGYFLVQDVFWVIRVTNSAPTVARPWPWPDTKVYDPQGDYCAAGSPGPYYRGTLGNWQFPSDRVERQLAACGLRNSP